MAVHTAMYACTAVHGKLCKMYYLHKILKYYNIMVFNHSNALDLKICRVIFVWY